MTFDIRNCIYKHDFAKNEFRWIGYGLEEEMATLDLASLFESRTRFFVVGVSLRVEKLC